MIYDANGRALKRATGYVRQLVPCDAGGWADAIGSRIVGVEEPEACEECQRHEPDGSDYLSVSVTSVL